MIFETNFMKLYEELSEINSNTDLESIVNAIATEVEKYDENGSNQNCLFSTWSVELQLRGEKFLPRPVYSPRDPIFNIKGEELVVEPEVLKISSKEDVETQVLEAGDGARFYCHVNWADSKGGHEFLLINDNDSVLVVDGQAGYIKEINKDKKYFGDINFKNSYIVRFDNKEINQDILKYNDKDQIVEWDDELDLKLLEEGLSQIDYLPVSDVELFKEYADNILDGYGNMSDADIKNSIKEIKFEGRLAGYIGFSEYEENGNKCLGIGNFMIIERGKGLGSAVIQDIVEKYKNQYDLIYCFVDAKNNGAIKLYKKLGKVYDEDGPNDNGEYYVTFWDNGKWELDEALTEKWETLDSRWGPEKLWYSTSVSEFRAFLQNAASAGIKGLRLSIGDGIYLAARASDLDHDTIVDTAVENYLIDGTEDFEWSTCGFPELADFDSDNFEGKDWDEDDLAWKAEMDADRDAKYAALAGKEYQVLTPETGEWHTFVRDGKRHMLVADCGTFEVALYNFYSREYPAYKNGDGGVRTDFQLFETSNTYFAIKPLIKRLYMTNT